MIINDRRSSSTYAAPEGTGEIVIARGSADVRRTLTAMERPPQQVTDALSRGRMGAALTDFTEANRMRTQRTAGRRTASGTLDFATQRPRDPEFYYEQNNALFNTDKPDDLMRLRRLCRRLYLSHHLLASAIDIFSKWPLVDMHFDCKDSALVEFYDTLFFDQLDYEEFLPDIGREYWTVGEAWPLGSWNEDLGIWEDDELVNPDDVFVEKSPFLRDPRLFIRLPESLRKILRSGQPKPEYDALVRSYPELLHFTGENARMPVSNHLLKQLKFKGDTFNHRGIPIMLRGLRAVIQEEMLNSAQDAIADRLYTPMILVKLGASATDLGTTNPWVPTPGQIADFEASMDAALAADFRVMTTHFAVEVESLFGKETMPNFDDDFERIAERQLQVFGMSKTMLSGAGSGETYAADALNRDLISQLLTPFQRYVKRFVRDRALVVAEAQGHHDYEMRGSQKVAIMEEVLIVDEDGTKRIEQRPKLLVPELTLRTMNMADEENERQFLASLRAEGVPISIKTRVANMDLDLKAEIEASRQEQIDLAVEAQETRKAIYSRLRDADLPIPKDLMDDFAARAMDGDGNKVDSQQGSGGTTETRVPQLGVDDPSHAALAPTEQDLMVPPGQPLEGPGAAPAADPESAAGGAQVVPLPVNKAVMPGVARPGQQRPAESDSQRMNMPKPAVRVRVGEDAAGHDTYATYAQGLIAGPSHLARRTPQDIPADPDGDTSKSA